MDRTTYHYTRLLRHPSSLALNNSKDWASTTSLPSLVRSHLECYVQPGLHRTRETWTHWGQSSEGPWSEVCLQCKRLRPGPVQPGEENAQANVINVTRTWKEDVKRIKPGSFIYWKKRQLVQLVQTETSGDIFWFWGWLSTGCAERLWSLSSDLFNNFLHKILCNQICVLSLVLGLN